MPRSHDIGYLAGLPPPGHRRAAPVAGLADLGQFPCTAANADLPVEARAG